MAHKILKELSIQVNLNGLSFCIFNTSTKSIDFTKTLNFKEKLTPFDTLNHLKAELASNSIFSDNFSAVRVIHYNELATIVPKAFYDEAHNAEYLKFNSKILKTDFIASDDLKNLDAVSVYVPYVNINNYIFDTFGTFSYQHASTVFLDSICDNNLNNQSFCVNIEKNTMQVAIFNSGQLELYNYFEFYAPEDFIYYVLFTCEQKKINPEDLKLFITGDIKQNDANYAIAYKYIKAIEIIDNSEHFLIKNSF